MDLTAILDTIRTSTDRITVDNAFASLIKRSDVGRMIGRWLARAQNSQKDDLRQEIHIELYNRAMTYQAPPTDDECRAYISNWIRGGAAAYYLPFKAKKRTPTRDVWSIDPEKDDDDGDINHPTSREQEPIDNLIQKETIKSVRHAINYASLSEDEFAALDAVTFGHMAYDAVADQMQIDNKSVDNAIQRAKDKIKITIENVAKHAEMERKGHKRAPNIEWDKSRNKWMVRIVTNGERIYLGRYDDYDEACFAARAAKSNPTIIKKKKSAVKKKKKKIGVWHYKPTDKWVADVHFPDGRRTKYFKTHDEARKQANKWLRERARMKESAPQKTNEEACKSPIKQSTAKTSQS